MRKLGWIAVAGCCLAFIPAFSQQPSAPLPPDYRGVSMRIPGIFVTPVAGAPFTADVEITSKERLPDGETNVRTTVNHIARDASGRIYNERRQMVSAQFKGEPVLLSAHIYDPATRLSTFLDPFTHLARQSVLPRPEPTKASVPVLGPHAGAVPAGEENIGQQTLDGIELQGIRKSWRVPAAASGTGQDVVIADQYWYSPELSIYLILQHDDPRTGEQIVAVKNVKRGEPEAAIFVIPARYRVVDETPAP